MNNKRSVIIDAEDAIYIYNEWLQTNDIELKILIMLSILAENNLAYRGTLKTMCEWLGIKSSSVNNKNILQAIESLNNKKFVIVNVEGRTYTLSITNQGLKNSNCRKVRKLWLTAIRNYNLDENNQKIDTQISIGWIQIIKVFIYLYFSSSKQLIRITAKEISDILKISEDTVNKAINALIKINFEGLTIEREIQKIKIDDEKWITEGSSIVIGVYFDD